MSAAPVVAQDDPAGCALAWAAKVVCSAVYLTERPPREAFDHSASWMLLDRERLRRILAGDAGAAKLDVAIHRDDAARAITLEFEDRRATARMHGDQGAIVVASPEAPLHFPPRPVEPRVPDPEATPWPRGDRLGSSAPASLDLALAEQAADLVFANRAQRAHAFLVVHRGELVVERYGPHIDRETRLEGWSMGKTVGALLAGRCMALGGPELDHAPLFPEWSGDGDPRGRIRWRDLLQLSSGLQFSGSFGSDEDLSQREHDGRFLDHIYVYAGGMDAFAFCTDKSLEHEPGTVGRYRNCDPLLSLRVVRDFVTSRGEDFATWPQRALFDPLGIRGATLETDTAGNFLITGHDYARARDFARMGLLLLQDGVWEGMRLLPEGFVEFLRTPAPAWPNQERGASVVLNASGHLPVPRDAYWMSGAGVNKTLVVPSLDLVVVRMGSISGRVAGEAKALAQALGRLCEAIQG